MFPSHDLRKPSNTEFGNYITQFDHSDSLFPSAQSLGYQRLMPEPVDETSVDKHLDDYINNNKPDDVDVSDIDEETERLNKVHDGIFKCMGGI